MVAYSNSNRLEKQDVGSNNNTWGTVWNNQVDLIDSALDGLTSVNCDGSSDITLSTANGSSDTSRPRMLVLKGTPTSSIRVNAPAVSKWYLVRSKTAGSTPVRLGFTGGSTVVTVATGDKMTIFGDGVSMFNATPTVSVPPAVSVAQYIQSGMIMMWSGSVAAVPSGWVICDGNNGTPDLSERFIVATVSNGGVASPTGGSSGPYTTGSSGSHTHSGSTGNTTLTTNHIPSHSHNMFTASTIGDQSPVVDATYKYVYRAADPVLSGQYKSVQNYTLVGSNSGTPTVGQTSNTGSSASHNHTISSDGSHTHTVDGTPRYYKLIFIMKT